MLRTIALASLAWLAATSLADAQTVPRLETSRIHSTADGELQPIRWWAPPTAKTGSRPLLVLLHTWSGDYSQDRSPWLEEAVQRDWIYIQPNFRGVNDHPEACGSPIAQQDILDAVEWAIPKFNVDTARIYLAGVSGGGHMTMQMAAHHPERFSAASAWVGPTDLAEWHRFHCKDGRPAKYAQMIEACCGGPPGASPEVDAQYRARSPLFHMSGVGDLPLDLNAGVKDGKTGSVPIHHTLRAYNAIARSQGSETIPEAVMDELWNQGQLAMPRESDTLADSAYGRDILLRRQAGNTRVTIFEGTHEALTGAACAWLAAQSRATRTAEKPLPSERNTSMPGA
jgi:poly(3-hydroxybutyrate) depolymerase